MRGIGGDDEHPLAGDSAGDGARRGAGRLADTAFAAVKNETWQIGTGTLKCNHEVTKARGRLFLLRAFVASWLHFDQRSSLSQLCISTPLILSVGEIASGPRCPLIS